MDILIKNMEMPKCCDDCFACEECSYESYDYCNILKTLTTRGERMKDCPLVELPPHGRLKDESAIIENMDNAFEKLFPMDGKHKQTLVSECHVEFMRAVFTAPTVLEASK